MTLRRYLLGMFVSTLFCWLSFALVVLFIDPFASGIIGPVVFYVSLFFGVVGLLTIIGFYLRVWLNKNEVIYSHISTSFRQAILLSAVFIGVLVLQSFHYLTWWSALLLILTVSILELFFLSRANVQVER